MTAVALKGLIGKSLKLRGKILLLFAVSTLILFAVVAWAFLQLYQVIKAYEQVTLREQNAVEIVTTQATFKKQVQEWKDVLLRGKKPEALDTYWTNFQNRENDVQNETKALISSVVDPEASQLLTQFLAAHTSMGQAYRRGLKEFKDHNFESAVGDAAVAGIDRAPTELLTKASDRLVSLATAAARQANDNANATIRISIVLLLVGAAAGAVVFLITIQRNVAKPLLRLNDAMRQLATGDTQIEIVGVNRADEIGMMTSAVQVFKDNMIETERLRAEQVEAEQRAAVARKAELNKIADDFQMSVGAIVDAVSSASTELEASADTLTRTAETAGSLSAQVAAASEEASASVQSVATAAEQLSGSIVEISRQVQEASKIADEAVQQTQKTNVQIGELSQSAGRIGDVMRLITAIAEQTNLLALNATIEAARAGDAGKGFAVVAQEVKALAAQTAKATEEIGGQIASMQKSTTESVAAINTIAETIARIAGISSTIAAAVEEQDASTQEISRSVQQAAAGTTQVAGNIADVSKGANEAGATSAQVLSSAQQLSRESNHLKTEVAKFLGTVRAA